MTELLYTFHNEILDIDSREDLGIKYQKYKRIKQNKIPRLLIILKKPNKYKRDDHDTFYSKLS